MTAKFSRLVVLIAACLAGVRFSAPVTVKGYVLDSACAFRKGLDKPIRQGVRHFLGNAGSQSGTLYKRGGSTAIVVDRIEAQSAASK